MNPPQSSTSLVVSKRPAANVTVGEETPISKYLANLEKRKTGIFQPRSSPKIKPDFQGVAQKLNFNDDTFLGSTNSEQSFLYSSPTTIELSRSRLLPSSCATGSAFKRKRTSFLFSSYDEDEDLEVLRNKISDLEKLLRQTQAELIDSRTACTKLEQTQIEMRKSYMERLIHVEKSEMDAMLKCKIADEKVSAMQEKLDQIHRKQSDASDAIKEQRDSSATKLRALEEKISELEKENFEQKQTISQERIKSEDALRKLQHENDKTEKGAEKWIMDSQIYQDQLLIVQTQLRKCQDDLKMAQIEALKYQEIKLSYGYENVNTQAAMDNAEKRSLESRITKFENLYVNEQSKNKSLAMVLEKVEEESSMLKATIQSEMILQEQITSLENEVRYLRSEIIDKGKIEAERNVIRAELNDLKEVLEKLDYNCTTPLAFEAALRKTQNMLLELKHDNAELKLRLESTKTSVCNYENEIQSLNAELTYVKDERNNLSMDLKKLSKRMSLVVKDRDGLKELKDSYEQEFEGMISEPLLARIAKLEEILAELESIMDDDKKACSRCGQNDLVIESLKSELESTLREKEELSKTLSSTVQDDTGVKILSFGNNPSMLSIEARLKECLKENEELKEKILGLEDATLVPSQGDTNDSAMKKMESDLKALERKHTILTEAYNYETVQLQNCSTKLFGFHVTLVREPQSQIRLQSVYSNCPDDVFIFEEAENSDMMLLETPILEHFREDIDRFLMREGSIPSFLASVTISYAQDDSSGQSSQPTQTQHQEAIAISGIQGSFEVTERSVHDSDSDSSESREDQREEEYSEHESEEDESNDDDGRDDYSDEEEDNDVIMID